MPTFELTLILNCDKSVEELVSNIYKTVAITLQNVMQEKGIDKIAICDCYLKQI